MSIPRSLLFRIYFALIIPFHVCFHSTCDRTSLNRLGSEINAGYTRYEDALFINMINLDSARKCLRCSYNDNACTGSTWCADTGWAMAEWLVRWSPLWVAKGVSEIHWIRNQTPTHETIGNNWYRLCCQCTNTSFTLSVLGSAFSQWLSTDADICPSVDLITVQALIFLRCTATHFHNLPSECYTGWGTDASNVDFSIRGIPEFATISSKLYSYLTDITAAVK